MARKARQRISYVLPLANSPGGHRLGVNSLTVDKAGILYSAGRDGVICSWNLGVNVSNQTPDSEFIPRPVPAPSTFRTQIQAHTHWVNDLVLCHSNQAIVSASSDLTVKLWRPNSAENQHAETIGVHSDYVKCLAAPGMHSDWVASGGLDRKIVLWDINVGGAKLQIDMGEDGNNSKGSVYAMGIGGGILASGGPESVVRVWDPRSGKRITKFVGHTDNVRSVLVSEHGNMILTASSDTTIKMWSLTAGRCVHTFSMHNDSVWSLHSSHPNLEIFHSSDRSGLVAKTDVRNVTEIDEGISVAVCQEQEGIHKVIASSGYLWTATQSSSINRWLDVDTNTDIGTEPGRPRLISNASTRSKFTGPPSPTSPASSSIIAGSKKAAIPVSALLRLSTTSSFPSNVRDPDAVTVYSAASVRQASISEAMLDATPGTLVPINDLPDETIEGQHGLIKHFLLNDRRRVLTLDTAGEVMMWDLLKCVPVKSFGKRHLEDVAAEINTVESVANWCQVDTRTGRLACVLEENYCFDAELYADELELDETIEFREDQRINLGKWVLRYLFGNLIDEETARDEKHRKSLDKERERGRRENAPPQISLPLSNFSATDAAAAQSLGGSGTMTPRATNGMHSFPQTPGMAIGLATPAPMYTSINVVHPWDAMTLPPIAGEDGGGTARPSLSANNRPSMDKVGGGDYFSSGNTPPAKSGPSLGEACDDTTPATPNTADKEKEEKETFIGRWRSFGAKKLGRSPSMEQSNKPKIPTVDEKIEADGSIIEEKPDPLEDTLSGVIKKLRATYETQIQEKPGEPLRTVVTPSLPSETPALKPPSNTTIIVQEDSPDSGGVADLYRGSVASVGDDANLLEKVAPAWLGDLILSNRIPLKDTVKVSFVLIPWQDELPVLPSESGSEGKNSRLNANRMLRAKKIMAYVGERLQPPFLNTAHIPETKDGETPRKPEDWLELVCHGQIVQPLMTLATIRSYVWKTNGDVILYYRKKEGIVLKSSAVNPVLRVSEEASSPTLIEGETVGTASSGSSEVIV